MRTRLTILLLASSLTAVPAWAADTDAQCLLRFDTTWSATNHPINFPVTAHFSELIGARHDANTVFWEPGGLATEGIQSMAELGSTYDLQDEITAAINTGGAGAIFLGPPVPSTPRSVEMDLDFTLEHPRLTLVTMIAPSPDWFVGVHGLLLFENGSWRDTTMVDLLPYDAGTDSGSTFNSGNQVTMPQQPISQIMQHPLPDGVPMGTFSIACESPLLFFDGFESGSADNWTETR